MQKEDPRYARRFRFRSIGYLFILINVTCNLFAQPVSIKPRSPVVCYQGNKASADHIQPPAKFQQWKKSRAGRLKTATFDVEYINFPSNGIAKDAFQFAIDIWETQLVSPVTIHVQAQWSPLQNGVLGQAIWGNAFANFDGAQHLNTFYPVALAEKIAGHDLNATTEADIVATFSSNANWYLGTDGNVPTGKMDLVTVVLHEIAHGLGFSDTYNGEEAQGRVGLESGNTDIPLVYDLFIENNSNQSLFTAFLSPSAQLKSQLTSNNLSFNSPLLSSRPKVYAPNPFNAGSSIAHLDEIFFNTPGDANKLMTPQIAPMEAIHSTGSILNNIFSDLGWVSTRISHTRLKDTERKDGQPYVVTAEIISDNGYDADKVFLYYTTDGTNFTEVKMEPTGGSNEFQASIPGKTSNGTYGYYIKVTDVLNRTFTNPGKIQTQNQPPRQDIIIFNIASDTQAPVITHTPVDFIFEGTTQLPIQTEVTDNIEVETVSLQYSIDGGSFQNISMQHEEEDSYTANINLPSLSIGDLITYRIAARDNSAAHNQSVDPETDVHTVYVTGIVPVRNSYVNSFNEPSYDFAGNGFRIETPNGFSNGAIHSSHPYDNGSDADNENNYTYQLQVPIRLSEFNPYIRFDEIVLVEPGDNGSVFGESDFYDYVIVEGSDDNGTTWIPFEDGYDARANDVWETRYNSLMSNDNSQATGTPALYRMRTINMLEETDFEPNDEILIRFRLFSDEFAHGWGWSIDNLSIQGPVTDVEETLEEEFHVYPNPASRTIVVKLKMRGVSSANVRIINLQGQQILTEQLEQEGNILRKNIDVSQFQDGLYIIKTECADTGCDGKSFFKKFLKLSH